MQPTPETPLPDFDQAALDRRFLAELERLLDEEIMGSYLEWATAVGVAASYVSAITAGRYHCNLQLLYNTLRHYPATDITYVLFGAARSPRPEPAPLTRRGRGRPLRTPAPATV